MKKFILSVLVLLALSSNIFAAGGMITVSDDDSDETGNVYTNNGARKDAIGFDLSLLGFELSYTYIKNHFELDANLAFTKMDPVSFGVFDGMISLSDSSASSGSSESATSSFSCLISPRICIGYNTTPNKYGIVNTFGGFFVVPVYATQIFRTFSFVPALGYYNRFAKNFNDRIEVGLSLYLPFVAAVVSPGSDSFSLISVVDSPAMVLTSFYSGVVFCSFDFKFYLD